MILLYIMFSGMKIQWQMIWFNKHQVSKQIEEILVFLEKLNVPVYQTGHSCFQSVHSARICSVEPNSTESDSPISETGGFRISRTSDETSKTMTVDPDDWRTHLIHYLENLGHIIDRKV
jgi:hypothetical protein